MSEAQSGSPIVDIRNLTFTYQDFRRPTLRNVSLQVERGETVLICGASGCGKSTLARAVNGLIPHSYPGALDGQVRVAGGDVAKQSLAVTSRAVGTLLQDPESQFIGLTVAEDVAFGLENLQTPRREMQERVEQALRWTGMWDWREQPPHQLSGGQKQKVAIAGLLAMNPDVLLLDEPLANLDPVSAAETIALLERLRRESGKTIIIIEHRLEEVLEGGVSRVALMNGGEVVAWGEPAEVVNSGRLEEAGIRLPLFAEALRRAGPRFWSGALPVTLQEAVSSLKGRLTVATAVAEDRGLLARGQTGAAPADSTGPLDTPAAVACEGVSFAYPGSRSTLTNVSLRLQPGERVALLGHNGAGKSTLCHLLLGLLRPAAGRVLLHGRDTRDLPVSETARHIGLVMQNPHHMISQRTLWDEAAFGPRNLGNAEAEVAELVKEALSTCDLAPMQHWPPYALSYGQKKRLTVAAVVSMRSRILVLDEPTVGQDYRHYREFMGFIDRLARRGYTLLVVTHDLNLALEYTDRSLVMAGGRLLAEGPTSRILAEPETLKAAGLRPTSLTRLAASFELAGWAPTPEALAEAMLEGAQP